jgi:hypothetical protein
MPFHTQQASAQAAVRTHGGYIVRLDDTGYWHCLADGDVLDLLDGTADATRADLLSFLHDFQTMFLDLEETEDSPVLYAYNVADYMSREWILTLKADGGYSEEVCEGFPTEQDALDAGEAWVAAQDGLREGACYDVICTY